MNFRGAEQAVLVRPETPDVGIAQDKNALLAQCFLQLHIVWAAQTELVLMNDKTLSVDRLLAADVFQGRPA